LKARAKFKDRNRAKSNKAAKLDLNGVATKATTAKASAETPTKL
jgi:hypothetical protein